MLKPRLIATMIIGVLIVAGLTATLPVNAQGQFAAGCVPDFNPTQKVYVAPSLANDPQYPEKLNGLDAMLVPPSQPHEISVYVVACAMDFNQSQVIAIDVANAVVAHWQGSQSFPSADFLLIVWVRQAHDPSHGSFAGDTGSRLQGYGLDSSRMSDRNGPVLRNLKQYMPNDPKGAMVQIVTNVSADIDGYISNQKQQQLLATAAAAQQKVDAAAAAERQKSIDQFISLLPGRLAVGAVVLALLTLLTVLSLRFVKRRKQYLVLVAEWQSQFDIANSNWIRLHGSYFGFLEEQGTDWASKFKGTTLQTYTTAVQQFAQLSARMEVAKKLLADAKSAAARTVFPITIGYVRGVALLTSETVVVTGDELPAEMIHLFSSVVEQHRYEPNALLAEMADLFDSCNTALASIVKAFEGAKQSKIQISQVLQATATAQTAIESRELNFTPYQGRFAQINNDQSAFLEMLQADPLTAYKNSLATLEAANTLNNDLARAAALKDELGSVQQKIAQTKARTVQIRQQSADYRYPDAPTQQGSAATFTLSETSGNPDPILAQADTQYATAQKQLLEGRLDDAELGSKAAAQFAQQANQVADSVLAAKSDIEKKVPAVRTNLGTLQHELPAASDALGKLKGDFLPQNYEGQQGNLTGANKISENTETQLAKVSAAYFEQRYLAAQSLVNTIGSDIQAARDALVEIHSRLEQLIGLRKHSRDTAAATTQLAASLVKKLSVNSITTSVATDNAYAQVAPSVAQLQTDVNKDIADWPATAQTADTLLSSLQGIDRAIDEQKQSYARAKSAIAKLDNDISAATPYVNDQDTRQAAREKLVVARRVLADLNTELAKPKSDWAALSRRGEDANSNVEESMTLARSDKQAADQARSAIAKARNHINSANISYSHGVTVSLSNAESYLRNAQSALSSGNYENAQQEAAEAATSADNAATAARQEVWNIEEAERERLAAIERAAEAARERQREQERERESSNYGGGSGGGNYGGGSAGGGNY